MQLAIILLATLSLCGVILFGLSSVDFSARKDVPAGAALKTGLSESEREKFRNEFKELLQQYENQLEPRLQLVNVELWDRDALFAITEIKKKVMTDFAGGEYRDALDNLYLLKNKAEQLIAKAENIYTENLAQASQFFTKDIYPEAKLHIEKALMVAAQSPAALEMQQQIEKLPTILPLLKEIQVARAEHDLNKEADFLEQVLRLAPERSGVAERLKVLTEQLNNTKFETHIAAGFAGIENRQVKEARYHYLEAKKVDPGRPELAVLSSRLSALEKSLQVTQALEAAKAAVRRDDWLQASKNFSSALKDAPGNKAAIDGLSQANQILEIQAQFSKYFKNPYRLANPDIHHEAERTLAQAEISSHYSFAIKRQAEQLRELINKINRLIPVTVTSDNKTNVLVRSVGKVGVVSQKVIQLKPGNYIFEGARNGFKSKLVQAFIPYDQDNFRVHVICDEPI